MLFRKERAEIEGIFIEKIIQNLNGFSEDFKQLFPNEQQVI